MSLTVGQKARRSATFTAATRFKKLIVQGGLTSGLLNAIVAMDLPGPGTVFLETHWRFTNPVFIGDTVTGEVEVLEVHASKPVSRIGVRIVRADEQLDSAAPVSLNADAPLTAQFVVEDHALRHSWHHLAKIKAVLEGGLCD